MRSAVTRSSYRFRLYANRAKTHEYDYLWAYKHISRESIMHAFRLVGLRIEGYGSPRVSVSHLHISAAAVARRSFLNVFVVRPRAFGVCASSSRGPDVNNICKLLDRLHELRSYLDVRARALLAGFPRLTALDSHSTRFALR